MKNDIKGYQVFLSRTHPQFLSKLFFQEVPEISERCNYSKKFEDLVPSQDNVFTEDSTIDPVGRVGKEGQSSGCS